MQFRNFLAVSTLSIAAVCAAAPAQAQDWSATGALEDGDTATEEGIRYDEHVVTLEGGQRYRMSVTADDDAFDTVLELYAAGAEEPVAMNDDAGDSLNSSFIYTATNSGAYTLRVRAFDEGERGSYSATMETLAPLPAPATDPAGVDMTSWVVYVGELTDTDPSEEGRFDDFLISMEAGETRWITVSADFDTVVYLYPASERGGEWIASDDDSGGDLNPLLAFTPDTSGSYIVRVTAYDPEQTGGYRLRVSQ